jgi:hypothetical protein
VTPGSGGVGRGRASSFLTPTSPHPLAKAHAGDAAEDEAANARPVTLCPSPMSPRIDHPFPGWHLLPLDPRLAWTSPWIHLDLRWAWTQLLNPEWP